MMPDNTLSTQVISSRFVGAKSLSVTKTVDYEDGGVDIQDISGGLLFQRWRARLFRAGTDESYIMLDAPIVPEFAVLTLPYLEEMSFSFDQSMRPAIAYVQDGVSFLWWYDSTIPGMATTEIGDDVVTPRLSFDDKRTIGSQGFLISDLILAYVRGGNLYMRMQRDRFEDEYLLAEDVTPLIKIGMNRGLRLQFMHEAF
jgi:hypothetical protein